MDGPPIPPLDLLAPDGGRVTVAPGSLDDRIGELADALGLDARQPVLLDGRPVGRHETLRRAGVRHGSRLSVVAERPNDDGGEHGPSPMVAVTAEAGPSAGERVALGPGRHVVGRAPCAAVALDDPALELHHAQFDVAPGGTVRFVQLTGRVAARIDGDPVAASSDVLGGQRITVGTSRLRIEPIVDCPVELAALTVDGSDPWRRTLQRTPRPRPEWRPTPITVPGGEAPSRRSHHAGLAAAVCTLLGALVVALVLRTPMFLLLGAVGLLAALGMWGTGRIGAHRDRRRYGRRHDRELSTFTSAVAEQRATRLAHHLATTPTVVDALGAATGLQAGVWARRPEHADAHRVALGWGAQALVLTVEPPAGGAPIDPELAATVAAAEHHPDAPVAATLAPGDSIAVAGPGADGVVRSLIVQLATWLGPADLRIIAVVDDPAAVAWAGWLPHGPRQRVAVVAADDHDAQAGALAALADDADRLVLVVTDRPDLLAQRTGQLRRSVALSAVAVLVHVPDGESIPALCRSVLAVGSVGLARWWPDATATGFGSANGSVVVHVAGITAHRAGDAARALAGLRDPEDPAAATDALATSVTLGALCTRYGAGPIDDAIAIAARWRANGVDPPPTAALGIAVDGVVEIDLVSDGPHALVAGTTGSGKSELLRTLVVSLAARCSPDHLTFVLVDYKGGSTFDACADLPHTVGVVTDLDDQLAARALCSLDAEVRRRERLLRAAGATDLAEYRADPTRTPLPRLVVVVDEFAALAADLPTFLSALVAVAQRGRSLGVHLVLATQRPAGVVDDEIRANTSLRLALRLHDAADARDVVGHDAPAGFSRATPGRAMLRLGPHDHVVFQAARCSSPASVAMDEHLRVVTSAAPRARNGTLTELAVLVRSIRNAAVLTDAGVPHRPWLPPLPTHLDGDDLADGAIGLVDVPAEQRRTGLHWTPAAGNLALLGAVGSGTTTALLAIVGELAVEHVYVLDARGDDRLAGLAGAVVHPHETERVGRLLDRLAGELDRRRAGARQDAPDIVLAVDGLPGLRAALDRPGDHVRWEQVVRIVGEGPAVGITSILTSDRPTAVPASVLGTCSERWVFHLADPHEASACGIRHAVVPPAIPGRLVVASTGRAAQVAAPGDGLGTMTLRGSAIDVLPRSVDAAGLPCGAARSSGDLDLVLGIDHATLGVAPLTVPPGEHVLVAGPARSGRTTALARLAESWQQARPDGQVIASSTVGPDGLVAAVEAAGAGPVLVVIDDAEHVDEPGLSALLAARRPDLLVIAAGRPASLRAAYGHWTTVLRRSRLGLLMASCADTDGDLLGELLPRHRPLAARPGLAWVVDGGERRLVQLGWRPDRGP